MVSVIMAAYNAREFIPRAIKSVFSQTYGDYEVVVVDDASDDGTFEVLAQYKDKRLKVLRNEKRSGAAFSRNRAIKESRRKYVAILDADDFWDPGKLESQVRFMEENRKVAGVGTYVYETDSEGVPLKKLRFPLQPESIKCSTFFRCSFVHSSMMLRRSFLVEKDLWYNPRLKAAHDFELWSRAVFNGHFTLLPKYFTYYRRSSGQISAAHLPMQENYAVSIYKVLLQRLGFIPLEDQLQAHLQLVGIGVRNLSVRDILLWCAALHDKNKQVKLFVSRNFSSEILLRFLKYCEEQSLGFIRICGLLLHLHLRMGTVVFPYFQLFRRLSVQMKHV